MTDTMTAVHPELDETVERFDAIHGADWPAKINTETLQMNSNAKCLMAQLSGKGDAFAHPLAREHGASKAQGTSGTLDSLHLVASQRTNEALTRKWTQKIEALRAARDLTAA